MKVKVWGGRGSLPAASFADATRAKIRIALEAAVDKALASKDDIDKFIDELPFWVRGGYGSNTPCVEIQRGDEYVICDAGSGLRDLGAEAQRAGIGPTRFHIFISHLHWDHIHGFPFFAPAYMPGNQVDIYGVHEALESAFVDQQESRFFPAPFSAMAADVRFHVLDPRQIHDIAGFSISILEQQHPGRSYGFSFEKNRKKVVYSTDSEHQIDPTGEESPFLEFFKDADLLFFDAQYSLSETLFCKWDWGHSSNLVGVELAAESRVKHLCLFHAEPLRDDELLDGILTKTRDYVAIFDSDSSLRVSMAYDGLEIEL